MITTILIFLISFQCYTTEDQDNIKSCIICMDDETVVDEKSTQGWTACSRCNAPCHCFCLKKWQVKQKKMVKNPQFSCLQCNVQFSNDLLTILDGVSIRNRTLNRLLRQISLLFEFTRIREKAIEPFVLWLSRYHHS